MAMKYRFKGLFFRFIRPRLIRAAYAKNASAKNVFFEKTRLIRTNDDAKNEKRFLHCRKRSQRGSFCCFFFGKFSTFWPSFSALKVMALSKQDVIQMCILDGIKLWCENNISALVWDDQYRPQKRQRVRPSKINYGETNWGRALDNPRDKDPYSREGNFFYSGFGSP